MRESYSQVHKTDHHGTDVHDQELKKVQEAEGQSRRLEFFTLG